jgi:hypothetical protein
MRMKMTMASADTKMETSCWDMNKARNIRSRTRHITNTDRMCFFRNLNVLS